MIALDAKIKSLIPYYADTNTVYDGTTNIVMLTVTGLWASLGIGDKTNQFTRTPCWTNSISTNWVVNYTSYWPSTNGTATNICYTSDYQQVVNYALSWTATGGHVWVSASNWASSVVIVTNAATYGEYPWQIYAQDLEERYKVLNALHITKHAVNVNTSPGGSRYGFANTRYANYTNQALLEATYYFLGSLGPANTPCAYVALFVEHGPLHKPPYDGEYTSYFEASIKRASGSVLFPLSNFSTNFSKNISLFVYAIDPPFLWADSGTAVFDNNSDSWANKNQYTLFDTQIGFESSQMVWTVGNTNALPVPNNPDPYSLPEGAFSWGYRVSSTVVTIDWQFNYCTNKFW
jgi:hypothetical protein